MIKIVAVALALLTFGTPKSTVAAWTSFSESDGVYARVDTEEKVIALTFDDGPHPYLTPEILEILDDYGAKATFFVVGSMARAYPSTLKAVSDAGHEIGNHTYTHLCESASGCEKLKKEICLSCVDLGGPRIVFAPNEMFSWWRTQVDDSFCALVCYSNGEAPYMTGPGQYLLTYETFTDTVTDASKKEIADVIRQWGTKG